MRALIGVVLLAPLLGCAAPAPPPPATDGASFKERFAPRIASCVKRSEETGLSAARITAFCRCPYDVMASELSPQEMAALEAATFGSQNGGGAGAMAAIERVQPLVRERCGVNIGGPPG
jgi:hypothetical protein